MPPETLNPNATEQEKKEKKKFNFFLENWGITVDDCLGYTVRGRWPDFR
jgi:hypothetical protein